MNPVLQAFLQYAIEKAVPVIAEGIEELIESFHEDHPEITDVPPPTDREAEINEEIDRVLEG